MYLRTNDLVPQIIGPGLTISVSSGEVFFPGLNQRVDIPATHVTLLPNSTTFVYLDCNTQTIGSSTLGFPANSYSIAIVVTSDTSVITITDVRSEGVAPVIGGGGSGSSVIAGVNITATPAGNNTIVSAPGTKISQLTDGGAIQGTDLIPIVRGGKNYKVQAGVISVPQFASYTFLVVNGVVQARNNSTGAVDFFGTDAAIVINNAIAAISFSGIGGRLLYFKNGVYNLNSVTTETVSPYTSVSYCIGIPPGNQDWHFVGESEFGVVFQVTPTAVTAAGSNTLAAFWKKPPTAVAWNGYDYQENMTVLFPSNQRANQVGLYFLESQYHSAINCFINYGTNGVIAQPAIVAAAGNIGIVSPATPSDGTYYLNCIVTGYYYGIQVNTEHSVCFNSVAYLCNTGFQYGFALSRFNSNIYHCSEWYHCEVYDCIHAIALGTHFAALSQLFIWGFDLEYTNSGAFTFVSGITEATPGVTGGVVTWTNTLTNVGRGSLTTPFAAGSGLNWIVLNSGKITIPDNGGIHSDSVALTAQATSIGATNLVTTPVATSLYEIAYYLNTTTSGAAGTVLVSFLWNDGAAQTFASATSDLSALGGINGKITVKAITGVIQYSTTVSSGAGSQYSLDIRVLPLG